MSTFREEARDLLRLAGPLAVVQLGNQLLGVVDTAVVGRLGEVPLAAVGLGGALFFAVAVVGFGVILGFDPLASQAVGAGERARARSVFWQGMWLAPAVSVPVVLFTVALLAGLPALGIEPETASETRGYVLARLPSIWPFLAVAAARGYLQAYGVTRPLVLSVAVANVVNLPLSVLLVFGDGALETLGLPALGVPALGAAGAGWASTVCTALQAAVMLAAVGRHEAPREGVSRGLDRELVGKAVRLGFPVGLTLLAEVGVFSLTGVLIATLGSLPLAAHHVALSLASMTFMVLLAIGSAASIRVGQAVGREDTPAARRAGLVALWLGAGWTLVGSALFLGLPDVLARLITDRPAVVAAAVPLVLVAAAFQLVDGMQAVAAGALRGAGDTRVALVANVLGHYAIGVPVGCGLAFGLGWGARGLWWGLSAGLASVAVVLVVRFVRLSARPIARA